MFSSGKNFYAAAAVLISFVGLALSAGSGLAEGPAPLFLFDPAKTIDFPAWLQPVGSAAEGDSTLSRTSFDITPPAGAAGSDLLLTVIFDTGLAEGGFLRVFSKSGDHAETLAENLDEGTGLLGSRMLLIPAASLGTGATRIVFQTNAGPLAIRRLLWEWAEPRKISVVKTGRIGDDELSAPGAVKGGTAIPLAEIDGSPSVSPPAKVLADATRTPLLDRPARFDSASPAAFVAVIDRLPSGARLAGKLLGLAPDREIEVRVNGEKLGIFAAPVPPLGDAAYLPAADGSSGTPSLAAWRSGAIYLPARLLHGGENTIELSPAGKTGESGEADTPFALKDLVLECTYAPAAAAAAPVPAATP